MGGAERHRRLVIGRHAHAEAGKAVPAGELGEQGEIGRRLDPGGRDAHQAGDGQARPRGLLEQRGQLGDGAAALLRLVADIDLEEAVGPPAELRHRLGQRRDQRRPVDRMDRRRTGRPRPRPCSTGAGRSDGAARPAPRPSAPAIWPAPPGPGSRRNRAGPPRSAAGSPRRRGSWRRRSGSLASGARPASRAARAIASLTSSSRSAGDAPVMAAAIGSAMPRRQPLPRLWLMTDERQGEGLWRGAGAAAERRGRGLPPLRPGAGASGAGCSSGCAGWRGAAGCSCSPAARGLRGDGVHGRPRHGGFRSASAP